MEIIKEELVRRSPIRILDQSLNGGLGKGKIGVIDSKAGVGKTACLVHIALDKMLQGKNVLHISFAKKPDNILNWYDNIFDELAKDVGEKKSKALYNGLLPQRVVMSFPQGGVPVPSVLESVRTMLDHSHFRADAVIIDGLDFASVEIHDLAAIKDFAETIHLEVWVSVTLPDGGPYWDESDLPVIVKPYLPEVDIIINVRFDEDHVLLKLVKNRDLIKTKDLQLKLDRKTMLIAER